MAAAPAQTPIDDELRQVTAAALRILIDSGLDAVTLDAIAREAALGRDVLEARFGSAENVLAELVYVQAADATNSAVAALEGATDGADALTRLIHNGVREGLKNFDAFKHLILLRILVGRARFGLTPAKMRRIFPLIGNAVGAVEAKLAADRGHHALAGGIHPRRLAFVGFIVVQGMLLLKGLEQTSGVPMKHDDDDLMLESSRALGGAISSLRQLGSLNAVANQLAQMRSEAELLEAVPALLTSSLDFDEAELRMSGAPSGELPDGDLPDGDLPDGYFMAPVSYEAAVVGAVVAKPSLRSYAVDEQAQARLEAFASMVGLALENVRLYENLQAKVDERTRELRDAQAMLVQSEKMAALGKLVAGIAHEINTPAGAALSANSNLGAAMAKLRKKLGERSGVERWLHVMDESIATVDSGNRRIVAIVDRLRRFSRLDSAERARVDVGAAMQDCVDMVAADLPGGCAIETDFVKLPELTCRAGQLNQVFLNVLQNAADALGDSGRIRVSTLSSEGGVLLVVEDDGEGIRPEDIARVFDPGFTTRGVGVGTGLGLATCYQVVHEHGGEITLESERGKGTVVTIRLPLEPPPGS